MGILGIIALIIYNVKCNSDFLKTPIYAIINILVAVFIAYYLTQSRNDERRKKDFVAKIIGRLSEIVLSEKLYCIENPEDIKCVTIIQRDIFNKIELLTRYTGDKNYNTQLSYIKKEMEEYWLLISNHYNDFEHLKGSKPDLQRYLYNISSKLEEMEWDLYT